MPSNDSHECPRCERPVSQAGQLCSVCERWIEDLTAEQVRRGAAVHEEWKRQSRGSTGCMVATVCLLALPASFVAGLVDVIA